MLMITFISLVAFGVLSSATEDDFCDKRRPAHCFTPTSRIDFPDSVEALDKICPILVPRFKCLLDFKNKCSDKGMHVHSQFENINNIYGLVVEACDKDSKFHKELAMHLPCTAKSLMSQSNTCRPMVEEALEEKKSELDLDFGTDNMFSNNENWAKYFCMSEALEMSCFVARTSVRCGEETGDYVGSVLDQIRLLNVICPGQKLEEVKAAIATVLPGMKLRIAEEEIISKNK